MKNILKIKLMKKTLSVILISIFVIINVLLYYDLAMKGLRQITPVEYSIQYTTPLTPSQQTTIINYMINQFPSQCRPNSISVSKQTVYVKMTSACLTGDGLKHISDITLSSKNQQPDEVKTIYLDNNQIYPN